MSTTTVTSTAQPIPARDRDAILQSLRAGLVPRRGLQHIQVGRADEIAALLADVEKVANGGAALRFLVGSYGSGKTFLLVLAQAMALGKGLVAALADVTADARLHGTSGQARRLYSRLMANLATRAKPNGGALASVVERFVTSARQQASSAGSNVEEVIHERLHSLSELAGGYDFAEVVAAYWRGHERGDDHLGSEAVRWLRGEYTSRLDAHRALGVRTILDSEGFYDHLRLFALFVRQAGYGGLMICLDEMVTLFRLANTRARQGNYDEVLHLVNESMTGVSEGLGFLFGGTPELVEDRHRGFKSNPPLYSRLQQTAITAGQGLRDLSAPQLLLASLSREELYVLLEKLRHVHAAGDPAAYLLPDEALRAFMNHCAQRLGDAYFRTPRDTIRAFLELLAVLEQNPHKTWQDLLGQVEVTVTPPTDLRPLDEPVDDDTAGASGELARFKLR